VFYLEKTQYPIYGQSASEKENRSPRANTLIAEQRSNAVCDFEGRMGIGGQAVISFEGWSLRFRPCCNGGVVIGLGLLIAAPAPAAPARHLPRLATVVGRDSSAHTAVKLPYAATVEVPDFKTIHVALPRLRHSQIYSVLIQQPTPALLSDGTRIKASFAVPGHPDITKTLYYGDNGIYFNYQPPVDGPALITLARDGSGGSAPVKTEIRVRALPLKPADFVRVERLPNESWKDANPIDLGKTVFASADDQEYLDNTNEGKTGLDWYRFEYKSDTPKLCFFEIDISDHDVPSSVQIYRADPAHPGSPPVLYGGKDSGGAYGTDPTEVRHDAQGDNLLDWKFITRTLTKGTYYLEVKANHPVYQLRTTLYPIPPYTHMSQADAARAAVRVAQRYMVDGGDSFFHNTPRRGAVRTRAENITDETERCIACHPAHFTMLSTLTSASYGYRIANRPQFKFMMDKLYNAMAPLYGHPGAYWLRFDLAPTNGISRLGCMLTLYEDHVSGRKTIFPQRAAVYPSLVFNGRDRMFTKSIDFGRDPNRNYEFDGNRPISDFRVATDSWIIFNELARRTHDAKWAAARDHIRKIWPTTRVKDLEDRVEAIKGMVLMHDPSLKPEIKRFEDWIFARQHDDGGWTTREYSKNNQFFQAYDYERTENLHDPSLIFITAETVYALTQAGVPKSDPRIQKAIQWILRQQQPFGAWLDHRGELFLTPYKETCWSLIALSSLYPENRPAPKPGYLQPAPPRGDYVATLDWLDHFWSPEQGSPIPNAGDIVEKLLPYLKSDDVMTRVMAAEAIAKFSVDNPRPAGLAKAAPPLVKILGSPDKLEWRAAAWALRQIGSDDQAWPQIQAALASPNANTRRGAARIFYQYFYQMMDHEPFARAMIRLAKDPDPLTRIEALKFLWREWYRTPDFALRGDIVHAILADASDPNPLVRLNVTQAMYTILDENTVQLHQHWIPAMAKKADQLITEKTRIDMVERPLALAMANALDHGSKIAQNCLLDTLSVHYKGIGNGNDYDAVTFYDPDAARTLAMALVPLMDNSDPMIRQKAVRSAEATRLNKDPVVVAALLKRLADPDKAVRDFAVAVLDDTPPDYQSPSHIAAAPPAIPTKPTAVAARPE